MTVVRIDDAARLKRKIRRHLKKLGFKRDKDGALVLDDLSKEAYRSFHEPQRIDKLSRNKRFLEKNAEKLIQHFANGDEVDPELIEPELEMVDSGTWQGDLFRFASLHWKIPVSDGYGRRMRFLVWDRSNNKLIGLIALGDAVFNLAARDELIGWDHIDRAKRLCNVLDAYVLGAVPPYNMLLGGKLVATLIRTQEIRKYFEEKYGQSRGIISKKKKNARLVMVTTTSALGRSSVYNRLVLDGKAYLKPIGFSGGWGHFHISDDLFDDIRKFLKARRDPCANGHGFGTGPNWRLRAIRRALTLLGMSQSLMKHKLVREVFVSELATNAPRFLRGDSTVARYGDQLLSVKQVSALAKVRWIVPRAERRPEYCQWRKEMMFESVGHVPSIKVNVLRS